MKRYPAVMSPRCSWSRRGSLTGIAVALALGIARPALADGEAPPAGVIVSAPVGNVKADDTVYLKDGGVVRGALVDAVPGRPVQIQLVTGEIWSIAWTYIDHVVPASAAVSPPKPAAAAAFPSGPTVRLHVEAPRNVEITGHPIDGAEWIPVCTGACDKDLPTGWQYQVRGSGMRSSAPFLLAPEGGSSRSIKVDPGDKTAFTAGIVGACLGGPVAIVGLVVTLIGAAGHYDQTVNGVTTTHTVGPSTLPTGLALLGVGVVATAVSIIVVVSNSSTSVTSLPAHVADGPLPTQHFLDAERETPRLPDVASSSIVEVHF